jgi:hypothetical protein
LKANAATKGTRRTASSKKDFMIYQILRLDEDKTASKKVKSEEESFHGGEHKIR